MTSWSDLRLALRGLRRSPLFTTVAILSLALGIGANTAIFTLIDQILLRKLPVKSPDQLVMLFQRGSHNGSNMGGRMHSYPIYQDYQQKAEPLAEVLCRRLVAASVSVDNQTERIVAEMVSGNYFSLLGVSPALGRVFNSREDDQVFMGHPVVVLGYDYWVTRFARDPSIIGKKILVNNYPMQIVGVSAQGFAGLDPAESPQIRVPILMKDAMVPDWGWVHLDDRRTRWVQVFARLKPGYTVESAKAPMQGLFMQVRGYESTLPAAKDWSQMNFVIYHSALRAFLELPDKAWAEFEQTGRIQWASDLAEIPQKFGVTNVYAELGTSFANSAVAHPKFCAALVGTLIKGMGVDHVMWGTDSVWYGSPQWQIEALRRLEIPEDMQKKYGFAPLGDANSGTKQLIFSGNATRFYKIKLKAADNTRMPIFSEDRLAALKSEYAQAAEQPSNLRYGYVRAA